ncbi:hypothetical protein ACMT1E_10620 [Sphingomonas flavalba]|uniref:hypothetical protein n=1 Tax=Sphingomonas flavalba TaxID=2559804 RepID=UPI0039E0E907
MDIDKALAGLRTAPTDPRLNMIDDAVMAGVLDARTRDAIGLRSMALAAGGALIIGLAGTTFSEAPASTSPALAPLAYAPSTLLGGR